MEQYRSILAKELIFVSGILVISLIACIVCFVVIKKLELEKFLYIIISVFLIFAIVFGGHHVINVSMDLKYNSFETYIGKVSHPSRDTLILGDDKNTKLHAAISMPEALDNATIVYSKRSKIVVGFYLSE